jgi:polyvinyl alcohol dehydrogenase (cytochrome)
VDVKGQLVVRIVAGLLVAASLSVPVRGQAPDGAELFRRRCANCHTGEPDTRAPSPDALRARTPQAVIESLVNGAMRVQGAQMSGPERRAVAEYATGKTVDGDVAGVGTGRCATAAAFPERSISPSWSGWSPTITNTRFQRDDQAGLTVRDLPRLTLKWAFGFPDASSAWAQPTVGGGRVFVGSQNGTVYSLNARTGCIYWTFSAKGGVRTAIAIGPHGESPSYAVYFGDTAANAYALDAENGQQLWMRKVDTHPLARVTGAPTVSEGRLYVPVSSYEEAQGADPQYGCCSFRGSVVALDAKTGAIVWKTYMIAEEPQPRGKSSAGVTLWGPSGSGIWSAPTVDTRRRVLYVGTGNTYSGPPQLSSDAVVALDLYTGKIRWIQQVTPNDIFVSGCRSGLTNPNCPEPNGPDHDFGSPPMLTTLPSGKDVLVIGQKSGVAFAMDPDRDGAIIWQYRAGLGGALGGIEWGSAVDTKNAYFAVSDITRPQPGGLHAVRLATGERVWFAAPPPVKCGTGRGCSAAQSAAVTAVPGAILSGSNDGALRGYSSHDGTVVWEFDTNRDFQTVNGVPARGASMLGPGPAVAGGMLYVNSGYGAFGGRAGNVLLAFGVD